MLAPASTRLEPALNRVPKVTADFWLIKLMAVTVGETAADYLAVNLGYGLTATSLLMSAILIVALVLQFRQKRYVPWTYWLAVVLISVVGTLITDNLVDNFGVRLEPPPLLSASRSPPLSPSGTPASGRFRSIRSSPPGVKPSTGWRSCSPFRSAPPLATSSPNPSSWDISPPAFCLPPSSGRSPSPTTS